MQSALIDIKFKGHGFSPKILKDRTGLPIEVIIESGETSNLGYFKGKPSPYGIGLLKVDPYGEINEILDSYFSRLLSNKFALELSKVKEIIVDVETSPYFESAIFFNENVLKQISELNARLEINTIEEEEKNADMIQDTIISYLKDSDYFNKKAVIEKINKVVFSNQKAKHFIIESNISGKAMWLFISYIIDNIDKDSKDILPFEEVLKKHHLE